MSMPILDVAIGISFVYLLLSLICTTVNEMIAGWLKTRASFLDKGITRLLAGDGDVRRSLFEHPLIRSLSDSDKAVCPSYIPPNVFATAMMDVLSGPGKAGTDVAAIKAAVDKSGNLGLKATMNLLMDQTGHDAAAVKATLEQWYEDGMDRVSGWYKRNAQRNTLILACLITLALNADTLHIGRMLWIDPSLRSSMVEEAKIRSQKDRPEEALPTVEYSDPQDPTASKAINLPASQALTDEEKELLGHVVGWSSHSLPRPGGRLVWVVTHLLGWALTVIALSLGAPFWFDTLNRFMNIRNAGRSPDERRDKSQPATVPATMK